MILDFVYPPKGNFNDDSIDLWGLYAARHMVVCDYMVRQSEQSIRFFAPRHFIQYLQDSPLPLLVQYRKGYWSNHFVEIQIGFLSEDDKAAFVTELEGMQPQFHQYRPALYAHDAAWDDGVVKWFEDMVASGEIIESHRDRYRFNGVLKKHPSRGIRLLEPSHAALFMLSWAGISKPDYWL